MHVLVVGSSGRTGRAVVAQLLDAGHEVTAFSRRGERSINGSKRLRAFAGDARSLADVENAVRGHGAVVVTLGISESPWLVRLFGPRHTAPDVRSWGTRNVIFAMHQHGVRRLVVLTSSPLAAARCRCGLADRLFVEPLSEPERRDAEVQARDVVESGLDWVIAQPVRLSDGADDALPVASTGGAMGGARVSRRSVARFMAEAVTSRRFVRRAVSFSGALAAALPGRLSGAVAV